MPIGTPRRHRFTEAREALPPTRSLGCNRTDEPATTKGGSRRPAPHPIRPRTLALVAHTPHPPGKVAVWPLRLEQHRNVRVRSRRVRTSLFSPSHCLDNKGARIAQLRWRVRLLTSLHDVGGALARRRLAVIFRAVRLRLSQRLCFLSPLHGELDQQLMALGIIGLFGRAHTLLRMEVIQLS